MKIELINENQIKCTLTRSDLASHQVKLSELAYGTEKTRDLFQDMMDQAFTEFGFESNDSLMIEAIPVSMDCIVLMITKVDTSSNSGNDFANFSNFTEVFSDDNNDEALDNLIDCLSDDHFLQNDIGKSVQGYSKKAENKNSKNASPKKCSHELIYSFDNINILIEFCHNVGENYKGKSILYSSAESDRFYLKLAPGRCDINDFAHVCSLALEYGRKEPMGLASSAFMDEHLTVIISSNALQKLADV